jgi:hypothetical protein
MIDIFMNIADSASVLAAALDKGTIIQLTTTLIACVVAFLFLWCPLPLIFGLIKRKRHRAVLADIRNVSNHVLPYEGPLPAEQQVELTEFQREILAAVKVKHGVPLDDATNRETIRRAIVAEIFSDKKRAETFRRVDMVKHVTVLIACVFTPTQYEIDMSEVEHDKFYVSYLYKLYRAISRVCLSPLELSPMEKKARYVRAAF